MSKEKPEVGDVWEDSNISYRILDVIERDNEVFCAVARNKKYLTTSFYKISYIVAECEYLGKSKVSIKELFDVNK